MGAVPHRRAGMAVGTWMSVCATEASKSTHGPGTTTKGQTGEMTKLHGYIKRCIRCSCQRFQLFVSSHHHDLATRVSTQDMCNTAGDYYKLWVQRKGTVSMKKVCVDALLLLGGGCVEPFPFWPAFLCLLWLLRWLAG
ncbi:hypothetical protein OG21DRAFT_1121440 [Imleria badia]|nr:hypothetical protein OG21DRAFT_1121440 [Imleria badia]